MIYFAHRPLNGAWVKGAAIADLESELKMKRDVRDDKSAVLNDKRSKVGMGVAGDPAYGNDSPHNARNGLRPQIREEVRFDAEEETGGIVLISRVDAATPLGKQPRTLGRGSGLIEIVRAF